MDNGARCALIPIENKRHFLEVSADIVERVDPIFYGEPFVAARKALGVNYRVLKGAASHVIANTCITVM
jgi:ATP-dependent Lon protease